MRVLISGAGIAGPTLAWWLHRYGFEPTLIEKAPHLRTGGYIIDFWGVGFDIAERMGILPELKSRGYLAKQVKVVNRHGGSIANFPVSAFSDVTHGRYLSIARGDLASCIFRHLETNVETIFNDSITGLDETPDGVQVTFERTPARNFDLVVGADGLHSKVRELCFGPQSRFEKYLGLKVAGFEAQGYRPRDELIYVMYTQVGQQVTRFALREDRTTFLFTFRDETPGENNGATSGKATLRKRFENAGWECTGILDTLDATNKLYFDRVSQIRIEGPWNRGRIVLLGDAAFCVSLLAGQGSALAMIAAYILAGELSRADGDCGKAFSRYQNLFGPFVRKKQHAALGFAGTFAPKSALGLLLRNQVMSLLKLRWVARLVASRGMTDNIALPNY